MTQCGDCSTSDVAMLCRDTISSWQHTAGVQACTSESQQGAFHGMQDGVTDYGDRNFCRSAIPSGPFTAEDALTWSSRHDVRSTKDTPHAPDGKCHAGYEEGRGNEHR